MIRKLLTLKSSILEIPQKYPSSTLVIGVDTSHAKEQILLLNLNLGEAISALKKGKDKYNRPITNHQIADGLNNIINVVRDPTFLVSISGEINRMGLVELENKMDVLKKIAENIRSFRK